MMLVAFSLGATGSAPLFLERDQRMKDTHGSGWKVDNVSVLSFLALVKHPKKPAEARKASFGSWFLGFPSIIEGRT